MFVIIFGPVCMACSLVTAGEICPRATGRGSKASGVCDALLVYGLHYSQRKTDPENALTISGADRFIRRGGTCPLHAIFMNQPCIIWGNWENCQAQRHVCVPNTPKTVVEHAVRRIVRCGLGVCADQATVDGLRLSIYPFGDDVPRCMINDGAAAQPSKSRFKVAPTPQQEGALRVTPRALNLPHLKEESGVSPRLRPRD